MGNLATAETRTSSLPPQVLATLKWLATTLGVTGILLVIGFISEVAYQDRLGYGVSSEDPAGFCSEAGHFLLTLVIIILSSAAQHYGWVLLALVLAAGAGFGWSRLKVSKVRDGLRLAGLAVLVSANLVVFDLPTVSLENALINPVTLPAEAGARWPIGTLTRLVWLDEICARIEGPLLVEFRTLGGVCRHAPEVHERHRQGRFALNALFTLSLAVLSGVALLGSKRFRFSSSLAAIISLLVTFDLLMLPYAYAKTVRPTQTDNVSVHWIAPEAQKNFGEQKEFFLLVKTKSEIALLERKEGQVWIIPTAQVRLFQIVTQEDVLTYAIRNKLTGVGDDAP